MSGSRQSKRCEKNCLLSVSDDERLPGGRAVAVVLPLVFEHPGAVSGVERVERSGGILDGEPLCGGWKLGACRGCRGCCTHVLSGGPRWFGNDALGQVVRKGSVQVPRATSCVSTSMGWSVINVNDVRVATCKSRILRFERLKGGNNASKSTPWPSFRVLFFSRSRKYCWFFSKMWENRVRD